MTSKELVRRGSFSFCNSLELIIDLEHLKAAEEFQELINDLTSAGLKTDVKPGPDNSILILVKCPASHLGSKVYKSRYVFPFTARR